jgi:hypothetical protein
MCHGAMGINLPSTEPNWKQNWMNLECVKTIRQRRCREKNQQLSLVSTLLGDIGGVCIFRFTRELLLGRWACHHGGVGYHVGLGGWDVAVQNLRIPTWKENGTKSLTIDMLKH